MKLNNSHAAALNQHTKLRKAILNFIVKV